LLTNALIGTKLRIVAGYAGTAAQTLAMERGEIHANPAVAWVSVKTQHADMVRDGRIRVIAQYGFKPHPDIPDVPLFPTGDTDADRRIFQVLYARQDYGRPFLTPPGVPAERLAALRAAMSALLVDPEFRGEAARLGLDIDPIAGADLQAMTERLFATPAETLEKMRVLLAGKASK
jgi:hypothetical protein